MIALLYSAALPVRQHKRNFRAGDGIGEASRAEDCSQSGCVSGQMCRPSRRREEEAPLCSSEAAERKATDQPFALETQPAVGDL